jgi:putative protease
MAQKKIELLAPAGNPETFHAALDGGANAVYLGMNAFNARQRSDNFTPQTLSYLIPWAQKQDVKVYITLNTLVKDGEMPDFIALCNTLVDLQPDAVLVQDLGMAALMRKYFPSLELHASTQMMIHNLAGIRAAEKMGIKRVVPARELTLRDIYKLRNQTAMELELFIHGALCYSLSGNCLASSFIGGHSGNRGLCRMVCRRPFKKGNRRGFYFSPRDLQALDFVDEFKKIGIDSLKIEGRMKNSSYVYAVTSAYRQYLDGDIDREEARALLAEDFGREKTTYLLTGADATGIVSAGKPLGTGIPAGRILGTSGKGYIFEPNQTDLQEGDSLRLQPASGAEGIFCRVIEIPQGKGLQTLILSGLSGEKEGELFLVSRKNDRERKWKKVQVPGPPRKIHPHLKVPVQRIMKQLDHRTPPPSKPRFYVRLNSPELLGSLGEAGIKNCILSLHEKTVHKMTASSLPRSLHKSLILSLPPFIPERQWGSWKKEIDRLKEEGFSRWMIGNIGFQEFFDSRDRIYGDYPLWTINRYTQKQLQDMGFFSWMYSPEDDILNLKRTGSDRGLFPVYMHIPVFVSPIRPTVTPNQQLRDSDDREYTLVREDSLTKLISRTPMSLTHRIPKLRECGINSFLIDLSGAFCDRDSALKIIAAAMGGRKLPGDLFNHKRGLK